MYEKILLPVADDDARRTDAALAVASVIISPGGRLTLLHVTEAVPGYIASYIPAEALKRG